MAAEFSPETYKKFEEVLTHYPTKRAAILPTFWLAQNEFGYLSLEVMEYIGGLLDLSPAYVSSVASFYTMFNQKPVGRHMIQVCRNLSCSLLGGQRLQKQIQDKLGLEDGETTQDGRFTFVSVECLGSSGTAPVLMVNDRYYENVTPQQVERLLDELK